MCHLYTIIIQIKIFKYIILLKFFFFSKYKLYLQSLTIILSKLNQSKAKETSS